MRILSKPRWPALGLALALVAGACGLPESSVELIAQDDHRELLDGTTSTTSTTLLPPAQIDPGMIEIKLYFVGPDDKLEQVIREFPDGTKQNEVLAALEEGPLPDEIEEAGLETLQTQLPPGLMAAFGATNPDRRSQIVTVNPEAQLRTIVEEQPVIGRLIVTQIVCTALSLVLDEEVEGIDITDGGEDPIPLSDINVEPLLRPANRSDFDDCKTGQQELLEAELEAEESSTSTSSSTSTTVQEPGG